MFDGTSIYIPYSKNCHPQVHEPEELVEEQSFKNALAQDDIAAFNFDKIEDYSPWKSINEFCNNQYIGHLVTIRDSKDHKLRFLRRLPLEDALFASLNHTFPSINWSPLKRWIFPLPETLHGQWDNDSEILQEYQTHKRQKMECVNIDANLENQHQLSSIQNNSERIQNRSRQCVDNIEKKLKVVNSNDNTDQQDEIDRDVELSKKIFQIMIDLCCDVIREKIKIATYLWWKDRGWVVRSGLKFGVDFLVYEASPTLVHARYGVLLVTTSSIKWRDVNRISRLAVTVAKDLILVTTSVSDEMLEQLDLSGVLALSLIQLRVSRTEFQLFAKRDGTNDG